jgi:hypothetical protein
VFRKLRLWLLRILGGVDEEKYNSAEAARRELVGQVVAMKDHRDALERFLTQPVLRLEVERNVMACKVVTTLEDHVPAEVLKRDICRKMAEELYSKQLLTFDIYDDPYARQKVLRGQLALQLPAGSVAQLMRTP